MHGRDDAIFLWHGRGPGLVIFLFIEPGMGAIRKVTRIYEASVDECSIK